MDMIIILISMMFPWIDAFVKTYRICHFKYVQLILNQLFFNKLFYIFLYSSKIIIILIKTEKTEQCFKIYNSKLSSLLECR